MAVELQGSTKTWYKRAAQVVFQDKMPLTSVSAEDHCLKYSLDAKTLDCIACIWVVYSRAGPFPL